MKSENDKRANLRWAAANADRLRQYQREWTRKDRVANPEKYRKRDRIRTAAKRALDPNWKRAYLRQYHSGVTAEYYDEMLSAQESSCAICGDTFGRQLHADHDHATGEARGLLCSRCNLGVGQFRDSPELLRLAAEYLHDYAKSEGAA